MKKLLAVIFLCLSSISLASGKLTFKQKYDKDFAISRYNLGLAVYQPLLWHMYLNSWTGGGADNQTGSDPWVKSRNALEFQVSAFTVGGGGSLTYLPHVHSYDREFEVYVNVTLW